MSRIGKQPIQVPDGVEVKIENDEIFVKGPKGQLSEAIPRQVEVLLKEEAAENGARERKIVANLKKQGVKEHFALWGLTRALVANMIKGVTEGFSKQLEIQGVGYRAALEGKDLILNLGLSHPIKVAAPEGIEFSVEKNVITVSGFNKQLVGQVAAKIRAYKKPEPYKGKGIRYKDEVVRRKAGKKAVGTE